LFANISHVAVSDVLASADDLNKCSRTAERKRKTSGERKAAQYSERRPKSCKTRPRRHQERLTCGGGEEGQ
jgi:hypothetical protein